MLVDEPFELGEEQARSGRRLFIGRGDTPAIRLRRDLDRVVRPVVGHLDRRQRAHDAVLVFDLEPVRAVGKVLAQQGIHGEPGRTAHGERRRVGQVDGVVEGVRRECDADGVAVERLALVIGRNDQRHARDRHNRIGPVMDVRRALAQHPANQEHGDDGKHDDAGCDSDGDPTAPGGRRGRGGRGARGGIGLRRRGRRRKRGGLDAGKGIGRGNLIRKRRGTVHRGGRGASAFRRGIGWGGFDRGLRRTLDLGAIRAIGLGPRRAGIIARGGVGRAVKSGLGNERGDGMAARLAEPRVFRQLRAAFLAEHLDFVLSVEPCAPRGRRPAGTGQKGPAALSRSRAVSSGYG